jgi:hypothetical protein
VPACYVRAGQVKAALALAPLTLAALAASACSTSNTACDCVDPSLHVTVPAESAGSVTSVTASGPACAGATAACAQSVPGGCAGWRLGATASGDCHIVVAFATGEAFTADVTIQQASGCCTGFYPVPASAGEIDVPAPAAATVDAGGDH